jgi:hypothetical protein
MCKHFNEQIDPDKKLEMIEHLNSVMTYSDYESNVSDAKFENLIDLVDLEKVFSMNLTPISDFKPIQVNGGVYKYLVGRGIEPAYHKNIYQAKYWKNEDESEWIIVMLNRRDDKVLGIQIRNLKEGKRRMFKIYNYENILEWANLVKENPYEIDINEMVIYNKLSYYFNILNVNFIEVITIFEGYLDSLFYPNSIGLVGVNTDYKLIENSGADIQYFFDNDEDPAATTEKDVESWATQEMSYYLFSKPDEFPFKGNLQEGYAQFRNETKMRSKPDQFHQAVKQVKKKVNEINRLFEYMDRLKTELSEGEAIKNKKYTDNAIHQIKEETKKLFFKSIKLK